MVGRIDNTEAANLSVAIRNALGAAPAVRPVGTAAPVVRPEPLPDERSDKSRVQDDPSRQSASFATAVDGQTAKSSSSFAALRDTLSRAFGQTTAGGRGLLGALTAFAARLFGQEQESNPTPTDVSETVAAANAAYDQAMTLDPYSYTNGQMVFSSMGGDGRPLASGRILDLSV